ncbi:hypothetical protein Rsub_09953 [Raphidocelis subcapitata]|uniref:Aquaporin n=1 Tax=Raphidocelis subcapitata TaxID=307507 RepID=A0A2V0PE65_9CHLO|nr:hypothetical protein Rsub_09953 [Raphidocelis subcapitata]|eukprot:GBF97262.1 hypothetical protein Rsub_09953 [Raphidocelis subcapitata]
MAPAAPAETTFTVYKSIKSHQFLVSLLVEFLGVLLFSFLGSTVTDPQLGPWVNGLALAVMIYMAANISGGHLNPAVTMSTLLCGFYPVLHAVLYIALQILGGIFGSLLAAGLMPGTKTGMGAKGPGCFNGGAAGLNNSQLFGWECIMTFTLISAVYACGIAKPGHGSFTPLVVGLTLTACAGTGAKWTGAALNPARVIGPTAVFGCGKKVWWIYVLAQLLAAVLACAVFAFVSGWGPLSPLKAINDYGMNMHEAIKMWVTGTPPPRFRENREDNMEDVAARLEKEAEPAAKA